ncbi:MAG: GntR family transcriptional regulator [Deltaproteobacteria bacterium]|nr:GntR family transcriptional regulator [Deltaproteobacteria bacterium]
MLKIESIVDSATRYLEGCIIRGELKPGQQIKEQEVASSLGISRPPIREAFKILEAQGLITRRPNRGAFVLTITERDAWEIYTLKSALYELATRLAFDRISEGDMQALEKVVRDMEECVRAEPADVLRYQALNERYHGIMVEISRHWRLGKILQMLHNQVKRYSGMSLTRGEHLRESLDLHIAILRAVKGRDLALAVQLTREHISRGLRIVQEIIASENGMSPARVDEVRFLCPEIETQLR